MASSRKQSSKEQTKDNDKKHKLLLTGSKIQARRKELGFSQRALAIKAGISNGFIGNLEAGNKSEVSAAKLRSVADVLGLSYNYILSDTIPVGETVEPERARDPLGNYEVHQRGVPLLLEPFLESDPLPIEGLMRGQIDLQEALASNRKQTVVVRVTGETMEGAGIRAGDLVVVDTGAEPQSGEVVAVRYNGVLLVRRFVTVKGVTMLLAHNGDQMPLIVGTGEAFEVIGVVRHTIHTPIPLKTEQK